MGKRILNIVASFVIMLCIGGVYAWSVLATELITAYQFSVSQSQLVFGMLIATFPLTMIIVNKLQKVIRLRSMGYICGVLFFLGYYLASISQGRLLAVIVGIGLVVGISTGFGYWLSISLSVCSFPKKRGLVTGIVTAGFGMGALVMTEVSELLLARAYSVLEVFGVFGIAYGLIIIISSAFITNLPNTDNSCRNQSKLQGFLKSPMFLKLALGILLGTLSGLFVIGNLKMIGSQQGINLRFLNHAVSIFAISNFMGRMFWGSVSDYAGANISIFFALLIQGLATMALSFSSIGQYGFIIVTSVIGIAFGANFVLFAKETSHVFGVANVGLVYPYVFLGYAAAGIASPVIGGMMVDISGSFLASTAIAGSLSIVGSIMYLRNYYNERKANAIS
jgi:OFA family oxalate/formate antiporter-like MFS transporter